EYQRDMPSIQVLRYENVFPECMVFNTLGISHYRHTLGHTLEVSLVTDGGFDRAANILASTLMFLILKNADLVPGVAVRGVAKIDESFATEFDKAGLYFTTPFNFPDG